MYIVATFSLTYLLLLCRWNYAITSILEVNIRRKTHMWTWDNIAQHRENLKAYKMVYKLKLTQTKVPEETLKQLQVTSVHYYCSLKNTAIWQT